MTRFLQHTDDSLLRLATTGDEDAFVELYRRRQGLIYRFALHMSGNASMAEEVTQEVFMSLIRNANGYDASRGSLGGYLYGIARNHVLRSIERDRAYVAMDDDTVLTTDETPLGDLTRAETIESVRQAVLNLPPNYREAVVLCDLEEVSYAEAAGVLGVPLGTVRSRLNRGRALLVEKLRVSNTRCIDETCR
jgi:RNA polymerase sigma-70 factor (ECF subfamily)